MIDRFPTHVWDHLSEQRDQLLAEVCGPTLNESRTAQAVRECYLAVGLKSPQVVWVDGPDSVIIAGAILDNALFSPFGSKNRVHYNLWRQLHNRLIWQGSGEPIREQSSGWVESPRRTNYQRKIYEEFGRKIQSSLGNSLVQLIKSDVRQQAEELVWRQLGDRIGDQLRLTLDNDLWDRFRTDLSYQYDGLITGGWWLAGIAYLLLLNDIPGIRFASHPMKFKARAWRDALKCHCWQPRDGLVIMARQHAELHRDNRGRLHNPTGPAWAWKDGTAIYALEGIVVPDWVIKDPDPEKFLIKLANAEQRRVAFANYGWEKAIQRLGMHPIDVNPDPTIGTLYELHRVLTNEPMNLLVVRNASPHPDGKHAIYGLTCPAGCSTAEEAQAALMRLPVREWKALQVHT